MTKIPKIEMQAAVLVKQLRPLELIKVKLPDKLYEGQVLVKIGYSGICGSQLGEIDGIKGPDKYLPHLLGHEGSGVVLETGEGVTTVKPGDEVVLHWRPGKGIQSATPKYHSSKGIINAGWVTSFNQYGIISENRLTKISSNLSSDILPLFGCAATTALGVIENNANLLPGQNIMIYGAGGIGLNMIQLAKLKGAKNIIAVDLHKNKLQLARECGATHIINTSQVDNIRSVISSLLGSDKLDTFIDNTGNTKVIELGYDIVASTGKLILVGVPKKDEKIQINTLPLHFGKQMIGSEGGNCDPHKDIPRLIEYTETGKIDLKMLISQIYPLEKINKAINDIRTGAISGRAIISL